ncbi:hypothetical protein TNCV_2087161 [Trichonephila clavipes]|nr:hypothetical protein TNCV_2087161 [Trichonephila clavipes]
MKINKRTTIEPVTTCILRNAVANDRCNLEPCYDELYESRSDTVDRVTLETTTATQTCISPTVHHRVTNQTKFLKRGGCVVRI